MLEQILAQKFQLEFVSFDQDGNIHSGGKTFKIVPVTSYSEEELVEIKQVGDYLYQRGMNMIPFLIPTMDQQLIFHYEDNPHVLTLQPEYRFQTEEQQIQFLANTHRIGFEYPFPPQHRSRIGQWEELWTKRLQQFESWCQSLIKGQLKTTFDHLFVESLPYYLGLTENAIQYVADGKWEDSTNEGQQGTICDVRCNLHQDYRFSPLNFVYDHPTRDLAEVIRALYWEEHDKGIFHHKLINLLNQYERHVPLSVFSWRMLYGRLILPLHYFEIVEEYYTAHSEEEKENIEKRFVEMVNHTNDYEQFLSNFYHQIGLPIRTFHIPEMEWLRKSII